MFGFSGPNSGPPKSDMLKLNHFQQVAVQSLSDIVVCDKNFFSVFVLGPEPACYTQGSLLEGMGQGIRELYGMSGIKRVSVTCKANVLYCGLMIKISDRRK